MVDSLFWVVVDGREEREELVPLLQPSPGDRIVLANGTSYMVDHVDPAPVGSHVVRGTVHAHKAST